MAREKLAGWASLMLLATAILILVSSPQLGTLLALDAQVLIALSSVLSLGAASLGLYADKSSTGKVGGAGGLLLFIATVCLLSFAVTVGTRGLGA